MDTQMVIKFSEMLEIILNNFSFKNNFRYFINQMHKI